MEDVNFMQAAVPALLFATSSGNPEVLSTLLLKGGTDADMAPPVAYLQQVLVPTLRRLYDLQIEAQVCDGKVGTLPFVICDFFVMYLTSVVPCMCSWSVEAFIQREEGL